MPEIGALRRRTAAGIAEQWWTLLAERTAGEPKLRFEPAAATAAPRNLKSSTTICRSLSDSVVGELNQRGLDIRMLVHPVLVSNATRPESSSISTASTKRAAARKFHPICMRRARITRRSERNGRPARKRPRRCRVAWQDWPPVSRVARRHRRFADKPAAVPGGRDRRSDPVPGMDDGRQFTPRRAR